MRRDEGHFQVLEAMIVTILIIGAAYAVTQFRLPSDETARARSRVEHVATDALVVLDGLREANGSLLELGVAEALHCLDDVVPSTVDCIDGKPANLTVKLDSYLPPGSGYVLYLGNGVGERELHRSPLPSREIVSASHTFSPNWNLTFVLPETSCQEAGTDLNVTLLPIRGGALATATKMGVVLDDGEDPMGEESEALEGAWNVTLASGARPASGGALANATAKGGTFPGNATYADCDLEGRGAALADAVREASLAVSGPPGEGVAGLGQEATFEARLDALDALPDARLDSLVVDVYHPLTPRGHVADAYARAKSLEMPLAGREVSWTVPSESLYGVHPVVLRATVVLTLPSTAEVEVEARVLGTLTVALPSGVAPIEPPYRALLQVWFPDWA